MNNIEKKIVSAIEREKLKLVAVCQAYFQCGLVRYNGIVYYFPEIKKRQIEKSTSFICPKHLKELYGVEK